MTATLSDFGIETDIEGATLKKQVPDVVRTVIKREESLSAEKKYDTDYIIKYISKTPSYTFDLRGWPNGINKQEFDRLWALDFQADTPPGNGYFWNDGHFAYAVRTAKKYFRADKERIWQSIERLKDQQLRYFMESYKRSFVQHCKDVCNVKKKADQERDIRWAQISWQNYNRCRKELGLNEEPAPEIFNIEYMNPLCWGDEPV